MQMDKTELGCLRAIILFNPGAELFALSKMSHNPLKIPLFENANNVKYASYSANDCGLFSPIDAKGLSNPSEVELLRERVYASLETYCKHKYPDQQGR